MSKEAKTTKKEIDTKPILEDKFPIEDFVSNCEALGYRMKKLDQLYLVFITGLKPKLEKQLMDFKVYLLCL